MTSVIKDKHCTRCNRQVRARLVRNIATNGVSQVYWQCPLCNRSIDNPTKYIKHEPIKEYGIDLDELPVIENYSGSFLCAVCQSPYAEYHHWLPRHLSEEADLWPGAYLCQRHHAFWHQLLTPDMSEARNAKI